MKQSDTKFTFASLVDQGRKGIPKSATLGSKQKNVLNIFWLLTTLYFIPENSHENNDDNFPSTSQAMTKS